jgi:hypothetical protein
MNLITNVKKAQSWRLFARHDDVRTTFAIVRWWESRRLPYNLIVGVTGVATCVIGLTIAIIGSRMSHQPILFPNPPLFAAFAVIGYGVMANVCFTGGWIAELFARKVWGERAAGFAQISFTLGVLFSVLLTLSPLGFLIGSLIYRR